MGIIKLKKIKPATTIKIQQALEAVVEVAQGLGVMVILAGAVVVAILKATKTEATNQLSKVVK
jgi:hypothetical protein